jgi:RNA polymerase sigma-70 factor (ECF subfamily)
MPAIRPAPPIVPVEDVTVFVARLRAGDEAAWDAVVRQHGAAMLACARRLLRSDEDSADAVQEAFVSAFRFIDTFAGAAHLGTWLHRIVINCCLMKLRHEKRQQTTSITSLLPAFDRHGHHLNPVTAWTEHPEERLSRAEVHAQVRSCIDRLPERSRTIILLRDMEGLTTDQTASLLRVSASVVKTRLHRGHQALRSLLEPFFLSLNSGARPSGAQRADRRGKESVRKMTDTAVPGAG